MDDDQLRNRMIIKGRDILNKFSWENSAKELLQIINSL